MVFRGTDLLPNGKEREYITWGYPRKKVGKNNGNPHDKTWEKPWKPVENHRQTWKTDRQIVWTMTRKKT